MDISAVVKPVEEVDGTATLQCPCGGANVHPYAVVVDRGTDLVVVKAGALSTIDKKPESQKGVKIVTKYWCENFHQFDLAMTFHKGQTFLTIENHQPTTEERGAIWRD